MCGRSCGVCHEPGEPPQGERRFDAPGSLQGLGLTGMGHLVDWPTGSIGPGCDSPRCWVCRVYLADMVSDSTEGLGEFGEPTDMGSGCGCSSGHRLCRCRLCSRCSGRRLQLLTEWELKQEGKGRVVGG